MTTDVIVVGGGIVGLATARALVRARPGLDVAVLEKEQEVGRHQTGHNSGVLHSGLYYRPGSHKAHLCVTGRRLMLDYCDEHGIPTSVTGKLVIATQPADLEPLATLHERGVANGLSGVERVGPDGIRAREPRAVGLAALHVPEAGVVDFGEVTRSLAASGEFDVATGQAVTGIAPSTDHVDVITTSGRHRCKLVVNCAGLYSDRIAQLAGIDPAVQIVPFRGEYYTLAPAARSAVKALIYPVPDPRFPFLGVHFTRRIDDSVEVGPNAVMAFGREHYRNSSPNWSETFETLSYPGMARLAMRFWRTGLTEMVRSRLRSLYARSASRLVPGITSDDLLPGGSGVRAQAVTRDGQLVDDFVVQQGERSLHVLNAPSPAATAALAIGQTISERALSVLDSVTQ